MLHNTKLKTVTDSDEKLLLLVVYITPDGIQDTYVEINDNMLLNANTYNALIQKSKQ